MASHGRAIATSLIVFVAMLSSRAAAAEPAPRRAFSASVDLGVRAARDDLIVPLASTGPSLGGAAQFLTESGPGLLDTEVRLRFAVLFDREGRPAAGLSHAMHLGYLPIWVRAPARWSVAAGPLLAWETDVLWLARWDDAHAYWMGRRFLALAVRGWRRLASSWRLDLIGELNLAGFESRPPAYRYNVQDGITRVDYYFASVNRNAELGSLFDWQTLRLEARVSRAPEGGTVPVGRQLGVELRFLRAERPRMAFQLELNLRFAYGWELR
jgi:hypothetical protein